LHWPQSGGKRKKGAKHTLLRTWDPNITKIQLGKMYWHLSIPGSSQGALVRKPHSAPVGTFDNVWRQFFITFTWRMLLASSGETAGMLLNFLQYTATISQEKKMQCKILVVLRLRNPALWWYYNVL
jgi:hypothetical protein